RFGNCLPHSIYSFESLCQTLFHLGPPSALHSPIAETQIIQRPDGNCIEVRAAVELAEAHIGPVAAAAELAATETDCQEGYKGPHLFLTPTSLRRGNLGCAGGDLRIDRDCNLQKALQVCLGVYEFDDGYESARAVEAYTRIDAQQCGQLGRGCGRLFLHLLLS